MMARLLPKMGAEWRQNARDLLRATDQAVLLISRDDLAAMLDAHDRLEAVARAAVQLPDARNTGRWMAVWNDLIDAVAGLPEPVRAALAREGAADAAPG